jgi:polyferredoxin
MTMTFPPILSATPVLCYTNHAPNARAGSKAYITRLNAKPALFVAPTTMNMEDNNTRDRMSMNVFGSAACCSKQSVRLENTDRLYVIQGTYCNLHSTFGDGHGAQCRVQCINTVCITRTNYFLTIHFQGKLARKFNELLSV